jgi:broad specificity phosphatase PhoE
MPVDLLRHGVTGYINAYCGSLDVPLTAEGQAQMGAAVEGRQWDRIYSSPLQRCLRVAEVLSQKRGIPCLQDSRLREMHFGSWEGRTTEDLLATEGEALQRFWKEPERHAPPGGETIGQLRERVLEFWQECIESKPQDRILVVTHGGPIRILLTHHHRRPWSDLLSWQVPHAGLFTLSVGNTADAVLPC